MAAAIWISAQRENGGKLEDFFLRNRGETCLCWLA
jgi:hypothetical protein